MTRWAPQQTHETWGVAVLGLGERLKEISRKGKNAMKDPSQSLGGGKKTYARDGGN